MDRSTLNLWAKLLGISFLVCAGFQLLTFGMLMVFHDWAYNLHSKLFLLTPETFDLEVYHFLGMMKVLGMVLFLVPWIAIKIVVRGLPE
jgi:hypothetical protein